MPTPQPARYRQPQAPWSRVEWHLARWAEWRLREGAMEWGWSGISHERMTFSQREPGPRIPRYDHSRTGPRVDGLLVELDVLWAIRLARTMLRRPVEAQEWRQGWGWALRAVALLPDQQRAAQELGLAARTYQRRLRRGREWLDVALRREPWRAADERS